MTELLRQEMRPGDYIRPLVAAGIDAASTSALMVIASNVKLTTTASDNRDLQVSDVRHLISELLRQADPQQEIKQMALTGENRVEETLNRCNAERTFAAISLACHIFQFDNGRWPASLNDLVPKYLGVVPVDPWGNGEETFGYKVIKGVLPDGRDRPLIFDRCESRDGLFYRADEPLYSFYIPAGRTRPYGFRAKTGGQFRDVAGWAPKHIGTPTTRPIE